MAPVANVTEIIAESKKALEENKALREKNVELETKLKSLGNQPDLSGVVRDSDGRVIGGWEESDDEVTLVSGYKGRVNQQQAATRFSRKATMKSLKRMGYVPRSQFKSFGDFIREGMHSPATFKTKHETATKAIQGMNERAGSEGGVTVLPEFHMGIFEHLYMNTLWSKTNNFSVGGNNMTFFANAETSRANGSRHGGLQGYWAGEGDTVTSTKPTLREVSMKLQKLMVIVYLTDELLQDSGMAIEQYVTQKAKQEFEFLIGDAITNGDGVGKPLGYLKAPSLISIAAESGQTGAVILAQNVVKVQNRLFAPYFTNAEWYTNQDCLQQLAQLSLPTGTYSGALVFTPPQGLAEAPYGTLGGRPIVPTEFAATCGTVGDLTLADLSQILSISKGGIEQATSMHVEFLTDQLALRFTMRVNAAPWENSPITPFKGVNTQSSFVTIAGR